MSPGFADRGAADKDGRTLMPIFVWMHTWPLVERWMVAVAGRSAATEVVAAVSRVYHNTFVR